MTREQDYNTLVELDETFRWLLGLAEKVREDSDPGSKAHEKAQKTIAGLETAIEENKTVMEKVKPLDKMEATCT